MADNDRAVTIENGLRRIAVAGNPNCGKTSLFNALTGLHYKVGNYPGVTVEKREGSLAGGGVLLIDLPGTYGLSARSPDEEIARDVLLGRLDGLPMPDGVLLVVDAANLERNLYLASQVLDLGVPVVVACNMMDVAARRGLHIDCSALSTELGAQVFPTVGNRGGGVDALRAALQSVGNVQPPAMRWGPGEVLETAVRVTATAFEQAGIRQRASRGTALLWLSDYLSGEESARRSAERFLEGIPSEGADSLRAAAAGLDGRLKDAAGEMIEARYAWIAEVVRRVTRCDTEAGRLGQAAGNWTDRIDSLVVHRFWGPVTFAGVVFVVFGSVFWGAEPLMRLIEMVQQWSARWVGSRMDDGVLRSLITDGIIGGVGTVATFFPQICLLFLFMTVLEDSGYMARAAFIMDRLMSRAGLPGKSFIPLVSCFACAVPGILATRSIEDRRDRLATILISPLMSCPARLPVYLTLAGAVFGSRTWLKAGALFGLYLLGIVAALLAARIFKRTLLAGPRPVFILELPPYHVPRPTTILRATWDRSQSFLRAAGGMIFAACVIVWALSYFPRADETTFSDEARQSLAAMGEDQVRQREQIVIAERLRLSYLGRLGRLVEPIITPIGCDWRIGVGLLSSLAAREAFVGTMGITFAAGEADGDSGSLRDKLASATWPDGSPLLTASVGIGLMVFYVLACQCIGTLITVRKETRSWRWPAFLFAYTTGAAYVAAFLIYQGARLLR
jgi:ferrous iron transport protein B